MERMGHFDWVAQPQATSLGLHKKELEDQAKTWECASYVADESLICAPIDGPLRRKVSGPFKG